MDSSTIPAPERAKTASHCCQCSRAFTLLRAKVECVACRRTVCRKCVAKLKPTVETPRPAKRCLRTRSVKVCVCLACVRLLQDFEKHQPNASPLRDVAVEKDDDEAEEHRISDAPTEDSDAAASTTTVQWDGTAIHTTPRCASKNIISASTRRYLHVRSRFSSAKSSYVSTTSATPMSASSTPSETMDTSDDECMSLADGEGAESADDAHLDEAAGVLFTIDTSEMARSRGGDASPSASFQDLSASIYEQAELLRQLRACSAQWHAAHESASHR